MKTGVYLLFLCELCVEISKADIKPNFLKEEKEEKLLHRNKDVNTSEQWDQHANISKSLEKHILEDFTLYNFTENTADFGFDLYRKIAMTHDKNVVFSPLSVSALMATYMFAAKGETHRQIVKGLNLHVLKETEDQHYLPALFKQLKDNITMNEELLLVQGTLSFIQKDFTLRESFLNLSKQYFDMEFLTVDFQNVTQAKFVINQNINNRTKGKIPQLFEDLDRHNKLLLVDYVFFKGKWLYPFNSKFTEIETFHINKYRTVQVPMMFKSDKVNSTFDENLRCSVIKLPYKGKAHMLVVIPEKEADYIALEDHLSTDLVETWLKNMKTRKVDISFPKFKLEQKYKMKKLLHGLGIKNLFAHTADLSHLTDQENIKVSQLILIPQTIHTLREAMDASVDKVPEEQPFPVNSVNLKHATSTYLAETLTMVIQKAVIEVDEKGTEATAATGSEVTAFSVPPVIKVDRPFLFMIFEETFNTLLFMGRVVDPTEM